MHHSVWTEDSPLLLKKCTSCCSLFHCPLCPVQNFKPAKLCRTRQHIQVHLKNALVFKGVPIIAAGRVQNSEETRDNYKICRCNLPCRPGSHFHCPMCAKTILRKNNMITHINMCKEADATPPAFIFSPPLTPEDHLTLVPFSPLVSKSELPVGPLSSLPFPEDDKHLLVCKTELPASPQALAPFLEDDKSVLRHIIGLPMDSQPSASTTEDDKSVLLSKAELAADHQPHEPTSVDKDVLLRIMELPMAHRTLPPLSGDDGHPWLHKTEAPLYHRILGRSTRTKTVQCSQCRITILAKNLQTHVARKHADKIRDVSMFSHLPSVCVDAINGIAAVRKTSKGFSVPVHVKRKTWGKRQQTLCELEKCRQFHLSSQRSGFLFGLCEHIRSLDYCTRTATEELLEPAVLETMVACRWLEESARRECLKRQKVAQALHVPLSVEVDLEMSTKKLCLSVHEPQIRQYCLLGRVIVTFNSQTNTWRCPCSKPCLSCPHKHVAQWHLFQTRVDLFQQPLLSAHYKH